MEAGTVVLSNNWHIASNDKEFPEARRFNPERWASHWGDLSRFMNEHVKDPLQGQLGFGSGRRVCVGWNVGWKNMFIVFSRLLYCFDFIEDSVPTELAMLTIGSSH
jgi:cytochrome P450